MIVAEISATIALSRRAVFFIPPSSMARWAITDVNRSSYTIRLIVIDADVLKDTFPELEGVKMTLVNPELDILTDSPTVSRSEGCLSLPGLSENVVRHEKVRLNWLDTDFVEHEQVFEGFLARIIQHEYDHLDGILYVDRISPIRKQLIKTKLNNIARGRVRCDYKIKETRKH